MLLVNISPGGELRTNKNLSFPPTLCFPENLTLRLHNRVLFLCFHGQTCSEALRK